jgi:Protein of unknown function (DUF2939)
MTGSDQGDGDGYVGLTPGSGWEQPGDSPIPQTLFLQSIKIRVPKYSIPLWAKRAAIVVGVLILCDAAWLIWPYYSLHRLTAAFRSGDIVALEKGVAWDSVRQGLRTEFNAVPEAAALTPGILEQALVRYVDPQAIAVDGSNQNKPVQRGTDSALARISGFIRTVGGAQWHQIRSTSFAGPFTFQAAVQIPYDANLKSPSTLIFSWSWGWRLTRIILPSDGLRAVASSSTSTVEDRAFALRAGALLKKKQDYLKNLQIYNFKARYYNSLKGKIAGVEFALKNNGTETLSMVQVTVYFKDAQGNTLSEQSYQPVHASTDNSKPLKPNQVWQPQQGMFLNVQSVPPDWKEGSAEVRITDIEFEGQAALQ